MAPLWVSSALKDPDLLTGGHLGNLFQVSTYTLAKAMVILGLGRLQNDEQNYHDHGGLMVPWRSWPKGDLPRITLVFLLLCWISNFGDLLA